MMGGFHVSGYPESRSFLNGILSPSAIQEPDPAALNGAPCVDRSRFAGPEDAIGTRMSVRGVATASFGVPHSWQNRPATGSRPSGRESPEPA